MKFGVLLESRVKPQLCPACGHLIDSVTHLTGDSRPKPGNLMVCIDCGAVMEFTEDLQLRAFDIETLEPGKNKEMLQRSVEFIKQRGRIPPKEGKHAQV